MTPLLLFRWKFVAEKWSRWRVFRGNAPARIDDKGPTQGAQHLPAACSRANTDANSSHEPDRRVSSAFIRCPSGSRSNRSSAPCRRRIPSQRPLSRSRQLLRPGRGTRRPGPRDHPCPPARRGDDGRATSMFSVKSTWPRRLEPRALPHQDRSANPTPTMTRARFRSSAFDRRTSRS